jgi:acyl carrier protein
LAAAVRGHPLDAFVLFSSASAVLGSAGQVNYAAASGYLSGLAHTLRADGIPATSIAWGPWVPVGGGGMAATTVERDGIRPLTDEEAASLLDTAYEAALPTLVAVAADFDRYAERTAGSPRGRLAASLVSKPQPGTERRDEPTAGRDPAWLRDALLGIEPSARDEALRAAIKELVADVLGDDEPVDDECEFADLGLDSIMGIDLRNRLAHALDLDLPATVTIDYDTIPELASFISNAALPQAAHATVEGSRYA